MAFCAAAAASIENGIRFVLRSLVKTKVFSSVLHFGELLNVDPPENGTRWSRVHVHSLLVVLGFSISYRCFNLHWQWGLQGGGRGVYHLPNAFGNKFHGWRTNIFGGNRVLLLLLLLLLLFALRGRMLQMGNLEFGKCLRTQIQRILVGA